MTSYKCVANRPYEMFAKEFNEGESVYSLSHKYKVPMTTLQKHLVRLGCVMRKKGRRTNKERGL